MLVRPVSYCLCYVAWASFLLTVMYVVSLWLYLRVLSPVLTSRVLAARRPSAIMCFVGRNDSVMMLKEGTVSVLRAGCDSTEGREKV